MTSVQHHQQVHRHEISVDSNTFEDQEDLSATRVQKQQLKKPCVTSTKILIGFAVFVVAAVVMYQAYTIISPPKTETLTGQNHGKMIENASGTGKSSDGGSSSTKSSQTSNKAIGVATTVSKSVFGPPSIGKGGAGKSGGDGEEPSENNDGDKRKNLVNKNTKDGSGAGSSTEEDSDSDESGSGTNQKQGVAWPETEAKGAPMVGTIRN